MLANEMCLFIDLELDEFFLQNALLIAFNYYYFLILRLFNEKKNCFVKKMRENLIFTR